MSKIRVDEEQEQNLAEEIGDLVNRINSLMMTAADFELDIIASISMRNPPFDQIPHLHIRILKEVK
jgi:hypothetical protein